MAKLYHDLNGGKPRFPIRIGVWDLDENDLLLIALLQDPIYAAELLWADPKNRDYAGCYRVRDYQYVLWRPVASYQGYATARVTGKTESIKGKAFCHCFRRHGGHMLLTAPELIHLLPLTDAVEGRIRDCRLTRDFLDNRAGKTGFTHRPFGVDYIDATKIVGRIPRLSGVGMKGQHVDDLIVDECFPSGTLILTRTGQRPIEQVRVGDEVFTHRGRWQAVTNTFTREREVVEVVGQGHPGLRCSTNHPFWAKRQSGRGRQGVEGHQRRLFTPAAFVAARDLAPAEGWPSDNKARDGAHYWASPTVFPSEPMPAVPPGIVVNDHFWWLLGFYMAEGCVSLRGDQVTYSVHRDEVPMVVGRLARIGLEEASVFHDPKCKGARVVPRGAQAFCSWLIEHVGRVAAEHEVKPWLLGQSEHRRQLVLAGYVTGDGNMVKDARYAPGRWQAVSADRKLVLSVKLLGQSLGYTVCLYWNPPRDRQIRGRVVHGNGAYTIRGNTRSQTAVTEDGLVFARVSQSAETGTTETLYDITVGDDHSFVAEGIVVSNSQDFPQRGWDEAHEGVNKDVVDFNGDPDFHYEFYGVHSGARDTGFYKRVTQGAFTMVHVTALQRPTWNAAEKDAAKAAYGGTGSPDYRRNILGEPGDAASAFFVIARLIACVDQDRDSKYNQTEYVFQELRAEEVEELKLPLVDVLDLPSGVKNIWAGMDLGLTDAPTEIVLFSETKVGKEMRLKLFRRFELRRFRQRMIVEAWLAIGFAYGSQLRGFGVDSTGLGFPIVQAMEDDQGAPDHLLEATRGYFFNSKVPVGVDESFVTTDQTGRMRDQYGAAVQIETDPLTGITRYVTYMRMIEASTRYLRDFVDALYLWLPFDTAITTDMMGETTQRVRRVGEMRKKPTSFHILDAMRAMAMVYKAADIEEALALPAQMPVLEGIVE